MVMYRFDNPRSKAYKLDRSELRSFPVAEQTRLDAQKQPPKRSKIISISSTQNLLHQPCPKLHTALRRLNSLLNRLPAPKQRLKPNHALNCKPIRDGELANPIINIAVRMAIERIRLQRGTRRVASLDVRNQSLLETEPGIVDPALSGRAELVRLFSERQAVLLAVAQRVSRRSALVLGFDAVVEAAGRR